MTTIDLTPLYRSSIGFDRFTNLLDTALRGADHGATGGYPPYNVEVKSENEYSITLAVAGFSESEIDIQVENGVLTIRGKKAADEQSKNFLYQGIATRAFERKFNLADYVEVVNAELNQGLLTVSLLREIPEAMKPKRISINNINNTVEHKPKHAA